MHCHAYHPIHPFWLFYGDVHYLVNHASMVIAAGAKNPAAASAVGYKPTKNFEDAWKIAKKIVGRDPDVLVMPGPNITKLGRFHLKVR